MKPLLILATLALALAGCQSLQQHNAQTCATLAAGQANADQAKLVAEQVREAVKGVTPTKGTP